MRNSFKLLLAWGIIGISIFSYACINDQSAEKVTMSVDSLALFPDSIKQIAVISGTVHSDTYVSHDIDKFIEMKRLTVSVNQINENQNGVCDTCVTGYRSVIIENRLVAAELSKETRELQEKTNTVRILKYGADKAIAILNKQSIELNNIVALRRNLIRQSQRELEDTKRSAILTARY